MMPRIIVSAAAALLLLTLLILTGCASTPVGVNLVTPREAYRDTYTNPLSEGVVSDQAKYVLNRYFLLDMFESEPASAIAALHETALHDDRWDILYALAETCYVYAGQLADSYDQAEQLLAPDYFLLSSLYAYYFVIEERSGQRLTPFDRRTRNALDLYNFGLWQGLATGEGGGLALEGKMRILPFGSLSISLDSSHLPWKVAEFEKFESAANYAVRGVSVHNRTPGIGLPLIGVRKKSADSPSASQVVPLTAFLRIQGGLASFSAGTATAVLEIYSGQEGGTVQVNNRAVPLATDSTTPLAYSLEGAEIWDMGLSAFLGREKNKLPDGLYLQEPYRPGKIPVVFVHGTASSPVWWTEMLNTLLFDPLIRQKYQFWDFVYTSNKPIVMSAADLRDALRDKLVKLDPEGKDPALQQMVVIGHSQGGLLTKLTAVDTGDSLVMSLTGHDFDAMKISEKGKAAARRLLQVKPLPFVKVVVFMSTPHRGSFRSTLWNRNLFRAFVRLPVSIVRSTLEYYDYLTDDVKKLIGGKSSVFTSVDGMSPKNPLLGALVNIPLAPWVKGHSIIGYDGDGDPKLGNDGVVAYTSAHLDGMESEFIVNSSHSSQLNPLAIDEVRRILVEHLSAASRGAEKDR